MNQHFKEKLMALIDANKQIRPFVCNGNPFDCEVIFVGINAATDGMIFSDFWNNETGFDFYKWFETYKQSRKNKVGKNKKPISEVSKSRLRMQEIKNELQNCQVLETNIYLRPTPKASELTKLDNSAFFRYLIAEIKPKVIVLFGAKAIKEYNLLFPNKNSLIKIIESKHYIFLAKQNTIANQIKKALHQTDCIKHDNINK
jgi:hypothetical protein